MDTPVPKIIALWASPASIQIECSICREPIVIGASCITLRCNHIYHSTCISTWSKKKNTCPLCRKVFVRKQDLMGQSFRSQEEEYSNYNPDFYDD